jgi:2-dehydropantoate 2-reductase
VVDHWKSEDTELGLFDNGHIPKDTQQKRLDELVSIFREGGTNITVPSNIATARWKKLIWNIAWNSLTALTEVDTATWFSSSELATPLTKRLMQESITVAKAKGVEGIEESLANELIDKVISLGGIYSSMYQDRKEGRLMEVEPILGAPVRWGRELGVSIPTMEILYALLKAVGRGQEMGRQ